MNISILHGKGAASMNNTTRGLLTSQHNNLPAGFLVGKPEGTHENQNNFKVCGLLDENTSPPRRRHSLIFQT